MSGGEACEDCSRMGDLCKKHSIEEIEKVLQSFENNPAMPSNIFDNNDDDMAESSGDEIEVVKANIYKYHGDEVDSLDKQIEEGILKFEYRNEDPTDDDILEIEVIDKASTRRNQTETVTLDNDSDEELEEEETEEEDQDKVLTCEDCGSFVKQSNLFDHREEKHPRKNRTIKKFNDGNFFMLAD